eukprot:5216834-Ditylum_brightwellii.AAC.1
METGNTNVQQRTGWDTTTVVCPNDIRNYQYGMGAVEKGDQHQALGAAFCNIAHFNKCTKKHTL